VNNVKEEGRGRLKERRAYQLSSPEKAY